MFLKKRSILDQGPKSLTSRFLIYFLKPFLITLHTKSCKVYYVFDQSVRQSCSLKTQTLLNRYTQFQKLRRMCNQKIPVRLFFSKFRLFYFKHRNIVMNICKAQLLLNRCTKIRQTFQAFGIFIQGISALGIQNDSRKKYRFDGCVFIDSSDLMMFFQVVP